MGTSVARGVKTPAGSLGATGAPRGVNEFATDGTTVGPPNPFDPERGVKIPTTDGTTIGPVVTSDPLDAVRGINTPTGCTCIAVWVRGTVPAVGTTVGPMVAPAFLEAARGVSTPTGGT